MNNGINTGSPYFSLKIVNVSLYDVCKEMS